MGREGDGVLFLRKRGIRDGWSFGGSRSRLVWIVLECTIVGMRVTKIEGYFLGDEMKEQWAGTYM